MTRITRHYVDVPLADGQHRRVHYRQAGSGPPLLMIHQSPRNSGEYAALMERWAAHFTCIAPDTPGFGQSDPLPGVPDIHDFADALIDTMDALGLAACPAYGFHSGGIILVTALRRHPQRFTGIAIGGYAIWTPEEMALFGQSYLPPFLPSPYGEHLVWLWNRMLEQSWFFPWFDVRDAARLPGAHADVARVDMAVREMLDAGDAYRAGYGAVLRAPRDIPPPDTVTPPVLISAYDGDPLQVHLDRLGTMPAGWRAQACATPAEHQALSLDFLKRAGQPEPVVLQQSATAGFVAIQTPKFSGLIHWQGDPASGVLLVHAPGAELTRGAKDVLAIDMPGHGLSDGWPGEAPTHWQPWAEVIAAVAAHFGLSEIRQPDPPRGDPALLFPDLSPDRYGTHLVRAWQIVRARHFFAPHHEANAAHAIAFDPADIDPDCLAGEHRALLRATAARSYCEAINSQ
ncbi:alpha/beta fold hydrolase [Blastomonas sp.]|uniref:alpha/beta fold hydrolase n=1 Tax=Blastomonas sp. TaxID=1909299 RepID=UPI00261099A5|nr:alpha/beta fold hydrolase [Blastomonas sp.]MDM7957475.1 alpha/beta fold hydrolase [Blastomonas sp.]